jgi:cytochrome c oxidase subunit IV
VSSKTVASKHGFVFTVLTLLAFCSITTGFLHLPAGPNNLIIFTVAFAMAGLVVLQYMGLKMESPLVIWTFLVPIILFVVLVVALLPDIAHQPLPKGF